mmetsp:Transcript_10048/g.18118  ORF Transcript_10048/g.18118 Transcript_10048/m.18118 type:complete len:116 (+) Transcript_10048:74-421(+)
MTDTARWIKKFENDGIEIKEKGSVIRSQADQYGRIVKDLDQRDALAAQFAKADTSDPIKQVQTIAVMKQVDTSDMSELKKILADKEAEKAEIFQKLSELSSRLDLAIEALNSKYP